MKDNLDWPRVWDLFDRAIELRGDERLSFIDRHCGGARDISEQLKRLLEAHEHADDAEMAFAAGINHEVATAILDHGAVRQIGRYNVRRVIGVGGMGTVYEAEQDEPHRTVALKVLSIHRLTPETIRRFRHESTILAHMHHPGIAHVYESGVADFGEGGRPYFAMEYIDGTPLTHWCKKKNYDTKSKLRLFAKVCDAVQYAHEHGVVHRDLKPDNILVDEHGQPKILDFGVARVTNNDIRATTIATNEGQIVGTVPYMSPEQIRGESGSIDERTDVYALGVILYQLIANRLPLDVTGCAIPEAARVIVDVEPSRLGSINHEWRGDLDVITAKALEKEKEQRYTSAAALAEDVVRYLDEMPISARRPGAVYQIRKFARRNKVLVGGVMATILTLAVGTGVATWQAMRATRSQLQSEARFDEVRGLARTVIFDLEESIRNLPGALPAQKLLVETALEYLERLRVDAADDPELLLEIAEGYVKVAQVQGYPQQSNLGEFDAALESYATARGILEQLYAERPHDERIAILYARTLYQPALISPGSDGISAFEIADRVLRPLVTAADSSPDIHCEYAANQTFWGLNEFDGTWSAASLDRIKEAIEKLRQFFEGHSNTELVDEQLADSLYWLACGYDLLNDAAQAMRYSEESRLIMEPIATRNVSDVFRQERLASLQATLGRNMMLTGDAERGLELVDKAIENLERLTEANPSNWRPIRLWSVTCAQLADTHFRLGMQENRSAKQRTHDLQKSIEWSRESLRLLELRRQKGMLRENEINNYFDGRHNLIHDANREIRLLEEKELN